MGYFLGVLAACFFGINPSLIAKSKTTALQQQICSAVSFLFIATITFLICYQTSFGDLSAENSYQMVLLALLSGCAYCGSMFLQYFSFDFFGPTNGFALSTASILIFNGILSVIIFKDWSTAYQLGLGFSALALVIIGAFLLNFHEKTDSDKEKEKEDSKNSKKSRYIVGIFLVILEGLLMSVYFLLPKFLLNNETAPTTIFFFQSIGNIFATIIMSAVFAFIGYRKIKKGITTEKVVLINKNSLLGLIPGTSNTLGNLCLIYANMLVGTAIASSLSQTCVVISTLISFIILKEYKTKTKKETIAIIVGSLLVAIGGVAIGLTGLDIS